MELYRGGRGLGWVLGDGSIPKFWLDRCLPNHKTMREMCIGPLNEREEKLTVKSKWKLESASIPLVDEVLNILTSTYLPTNPQSKDQDMWIHSSSGELTVQSTYKYLLKEATIK